MRDISPDALVGAAQGGETLDSNVTFYAKQFPARFVKAGGAYIWDDEGRRFTDFWSSAGSLNYGHNPPHIIRAVIKYLGEGGILQSLDMETDAKRRFIDRFDATILRPRNMRYRFMFAGPAGANAVEAALKLARTATGRRTIAAFTGAFHGMTLGALAVGDAAYARAGAGVPFGDVVRVCYDDGGADAVQRLEAQWDRLFATAPPAGVIVEAFQCDGGMRGASAEWLQTLERLCRGAGAALIVDDIQAGVGRTGAFFSFEVAGIRPDMICLSKSLGGAGFPISIVLVSDRFDVLGPGQHTSTFRGFNLSFVAAHAALDYWENDDLTHAIADAGRRVRETLTRIASNDSVRFIGVSGRGLAYGLACANTEIAAQLSKALFKRGVIAETCGPDDVVLKIMPPLTIAREALNEALVSLEEAAASLS